MMFFVCFFVVVFARRSRFSQDKRENFLLKPSTLNIPIDLLNVHFVVPCISLKASKRPSFNAQVNQIRKKISLLKETLNRYNASLLLTCLHLDTLGYRQLTSDLFALKNEMYSKVENISNIFEKFITVGKGTKTSNMIPIVGDKTSLVRKAIEMSVKNKRKELSSSEYRKKRLVNLIMRIAAHSRPLIIDKQPEIGDLVDLYDIWNDSASILRFR